ncbi:DUF2254 domain-containing protein [Halomonas caseinilytica]|uniref:DUF2254 domain-containing protein n=1 Tax=Halomonas caseinilytica TaxID=438744 RepID=UPI0007E5B342|nr:DUF2254 domain-containing protein [Halomonas caseinilytica]SEM07117.1 Uncharacterized membrane protein [Halomonas caseinilytica]
MLLFHPIMLFKRFASSIAYLPTLAALFYAALGLLALLSPVTSDFLPTIIKELGLEDPGGAQSLLTALLGGMISLVVFSFSMVMSVLSQAGANFSHKLVFGLISARRHQLVLGHYLGTILFILMLLIVPYSIDGDPMWRSIAVYAACVMVLHCLALFVYFIHNVSQSIQIDAVISSLHTDTLSSMKQRHDREKEARWQYQPITPPLQAPCHPLHAGEAGYIQNADLPAMAKLAERIGGVIHLDFQFGDYVLKGQPIARLEGKQAPDEKWRSSFLETLTQLEGESVGEHFAHGMTQLMEIAIKALSPGINDPGTARLCLHRITDLLSHYLDTRMANRLRDSHGEVRVCWQLESFDSLLHRLLTPILHYGMEDQSILLGLLKALKSLSVTADSQYLATLQQFADRVVECLDANSRHTLDRTFVNQRLNRGYHRLNLPDSLDARSP